MKNKWVLVVAIVALICSVGWVGKAELKSPERPTWEYQVMFVGALQSPELNRLGTEGWELATVSCGQDNVCAWVFKRRK